MLKLIGQLFRRYVDQHRVAKRTGGRVRHPSGRVLAERVQVVASGGRVRVRLLASADAASGGLAVVEDSGSSVAMAAEAAPAREGAWLAASVPESWGALHLAADGMEGAVPLPMPRRTAAGAMRLAPGFALRLLGVLPRTWRWLGSRDPLLRQRALEALGLASRHPALLDGRVFSEGAPRDARLPEGVTIILPVHNALELLVTAIDRVERHTDLPWHLIVIEDASSDPRVRPWLRQRIAALPAGRATLIENEHNLGFIASVNRGFAVALGRGDPVVLLNSDAFVPAGWASRLTAPLMADPSVASVTPFSNDAELMTVPAISRSRPLAPGQGDALDRVAIGFSPAAVTAEMPTGVGFCMAIARDWLARVPRFDPAFGRGYGEEVDWCRKVAALGGRHLGTGGLFVEHRGGASFGSAEKQAAIARGNALLARRYPGFPGSVRDFIEDDPLLTPRLALGVAWAAGRGAGSLPVYVAHSLGGGAEIWLQDRIAGHLQAETEGAALVLRLGGIHRWQLQLLADGLPPLSGATDDTAVAAAILSSAARLRFCYSCAVGDADPAGLPEALLGMVRPQDHLEVCFHDFFPLSPSYTLLGSDDRFRGVPAPEDPDPAHRTRRPDGTQVSLGEWRAAWGRLAARAERLVVFSNDSAAHVAAAWPQLADRIEVRPHALHTRVSPLEPPPPGQPFNLAVLGNIGRHKGINVVAELARRLEALPAAPGMVVIGKTDPAYPLPSSVRVHGSYALADLPVLAGRYRIGAWLIPSIWPETFSYATHEALATGLPVIGLRLGAQGEALARHANGIVVPAGDPDAMIEDLVDAVLAIRRDRRKDA